MSVEVDQLEEMVERILRRLVLDGEADQDAISSSNTTYAADGSIGAIFPGGVQILAGTSLTPPTDRRVRWVTQSGGALVAEVFAYTFGGSDYLEVGSSDAATQALAHLFCESNLIGGFSQVRALAVDAAGNSDGGPRIIGSDGTSSFLRLRGSAARRFINFGQTANIATGSGAFITHGFTTPPLAVVAMPLQGGNFAQGGWNVDYPNATAFFIYNNTGVTLPFAWIAIGQ